MAPQKVNFSLLILVLYIFQLGIYGYITKLGQVNFDMMWFDAELYGPV